MHFAGQKYAYIPEKKLKKAKQKKELKPIKENEKEENINSMMDLEQDEKEENGQSQNKHRYRYRMKVERSNNYEKEEDNDNDNDNSDSCESFDDDELNEDFLAENQYPKEKKKKQKKSDNLHYERAVDTNILSLKFEFLKNKIPFATGDPQYCSGCKAVFNSISKYEEKDNVFIWKCEFCNQVNNLQIEKEEIPQEPCIDFFVESSNQVDKSSFNYTDNQSLIYCFDVSGSMCVSYPLESKFTLKGSRVDAMYKELMKFSDGSDQYYQTNQKNITYVSRLQCLQGAIENNINSLLKNAPNMKVGIVTFNNKVSAYGDCLKAPIVLEGNKLNNENEITQLGEENRTIVSTPIQQSQKKIIDSLYSFEESGQTALGPAMLLSLSLIEKTAAGGRIILCTDGIANLGLGSIPEKATQAEIDKAKEFYAKLGNIAKDKGIVINLITFQDEESQIQVLMEMVEKTGGEIIRANPREIVDNFSNLLSNDIVATNVSIKIKLHKVMCFRNESPELLTDNGSSLKKTIGNATKETELYIEYMFKKSDEIAKLDIDLDALKEVPFQSIIEYTTPTGDKCIRVLTNVQAVSSEKDKIEHQSDFNIISTNAIQKTANIARQGDYRQAQANAYAWNNYLKANNAKSNAQQNCDLYSNNMYQLNSNLQQVQDQIVCDYQAKPMSSNMAFEGEGFNQFPHMNFNYNAMPISSNMPIGAKKCDNAMRNKKPNVCNDQLMQQIHQNQFSSSNQQQMAFAKSKKKK